MSRGTGPEQVFVVQRVFERARVSVRAAVMSTGPWDARRRASQTGSD